MSKIHINHDDVMAHPELKKFEGQTIESKDYQAVVAGKNVAPQIDEVEEKDITKEDEQTKDVETKTKTKSTKKAGK